METLIIKYLTNTVSQQEQSKLLAWLKEDEENKQLFFELKDIYETKYSDEVKKDVVNIWDRINNSIEPKSTFSDNYENRYNKLKRKFIFVAAAASIAILFSIIPLSKYFGSDNLIEDVSILSEVTVPSDGGTVRILLSDSTVVELKANSTLKYPQKFSKEKREVYLDGEAFFDVAKSKDQRFAVHTNSQDIEVLGTFFHVRDYHTGSLSHVTLVNGKIALTTMGVDYELEPSQRVIIDKENSISELSKIPNYLSEAFSSKKYHFKERSLKQILQDVEILYGVTINLKDDIVGRKHYTGTFSINQNIDEILSVINYKRQFKYTIISNQNIEISSK